MANRLAGSASPYLRLHADNPVDWYPWGEDAFARARQLERPIFLSVGYYTCHWCHVMERESFSDPACAALLNDNFVSVKVDREERPDVDRLYMSFVQASTGGGGWPMSVFLTPELKPFHGGTYYPPRDQHGLPGFGRLLRTIAATWRDDRPRLLRASTEVSDYLSHALAPAPPSGDSAAALLQAVWPALYNDLRASFDQENGGFGAAPKFPRPVVHAFLLRFARLHAGSPQAAEATAMVTASLRAMARGGMHDHLGGGFHRYAVDAGWRVPHFEKMLYDQAQLASSFVEAWQLTHAGDLAAAALSTCAFVLREMTSPSGAFFSAQDADSPKPDNPAESGEGAYYLWTQAEIAALLEPEIAARFCRAYGVLEGGNVPARLDPHAEFAGKNILYEAAAADGLEAARQRLYQHRRSRPHPPTDDKTLTAWNGLMISALAQTGAALEQPHFIAAAARAAAALEQERWDGRRLRRTPTVAGFAEDYAFLIQGLLDLHQASFDPRWLDWAQRLQTIQDELFAAPEGGYFSQPASSELWLRLREDYDGAEPSPNSVAISNLLRLALFFEHAGGRERAQAALSAYAARLRQMPQALPLMAAQLETAASPPRRLMVAGDPAAEATRALLRVVRQRFLPGCWVVPAPAPVHAPAAAYLCEDYTCQLPLTSPDALAQALV